MFGSARFTQEHGYCVLAYEIGQRLAIAGFPVMTGGGPGIVEVANCGAKEADGYFHYRRLARQATTSWSRGSRGGLPGPWSRSNTRPPSADSFLSSINTQVAQAIPPTKAPLT